jgi:hypothetical protein
MQRDKVYKNIRRNIVFVLDNGEIFVLGQNKDVEVSNGYCCVSKNKERKCARS